MRKSRLLIICLGITALIFSQMINLAFTKSIPKLNNVNQVDSNIRQLRTGDLVIRVEDAQKINVVGATVKLEQTKHFFDFGTTLRTEVFLDKFSEQDKNQYLDTAKQLFNVSVHENALKWYSTEYEKGKINYQDADKILNWSLVNKLKMRGHTLFWEVEEYNRPWVKALKPEELKQAVERRTKEVCSRYKGRIDEYDVLNEMLHGNFFRSRLGDSIVKDMFVWCKQVHPNAVLYVNDYDILNGKQLDKYVELIRSLLKQGVPVGGIGVQGHIREKITPERIQKSLDTLAQFRLPIKITEFDAIVDSEEEKARLLRDIYRVAFAHPAVKGILMWGFWEGAHWKPEAAIFRKDWQPLPAGQTYQDLVFNKWWTRVNTLTDKIGKVNIRAFYGDYHLTVSMKNQKIERNFSFTPGSKKVVLVRG